MTEAANRLYDRSRDRVYKICPIIDKNDNNNVNISSEKKNEDTNNYFSIDEIRNELKVTEQIVPILECPPKWKLLEEVYEIFYLCLFKYN
jgi:hypothetical protein